MKALLLAVAICAGCQPLPPATPPPVIPVATVDDGCHDALYPLGFLRWLVDFRYAGTYRVHSYPDGYSTWAAHAAGSFEAYGFTKPDAWWVEWRNPKDLTVHTASRIVPATVPARVCGRPV